MAQRMSRLGKALEAARAVEGNDARVLSKGRGPKKAYMDALLEIIKPGQGWH